MCQLESIARDQIAKDFKRKQKVYKVGTLNLLNKMFNKFSTFCRAFFGGVRIVFLEERRGSKFFSFLLVHPFFSQPTLSLSQKPNGHKLPDPPLPSPFLLFPDDDDDAISVPWHLSCALKSPLLLLLPLPRKKTPFRRGKNSSPRALIPQ